MDFIWWESYGKVVSFFSNLFTIPGQIAGIIVAILTLIIIKENITMRKASNKPLLLPCRIDNFTSDDRLFVYNFEYPMTGDVGTSSLSHLGLKNIGKGPAINVQVISFEEDFIEEKPSLASFDIAHISVSIPEGGAVPLILRILREEAIDYTFTSFTATISYDDIFGETYFLSTRLWLRDSDAVVIEYCNLRHPKWQKGSRVLWREIESQGYFEMRTLEQKLKK